MDSGLLPAGSLQEGESSIWYSAVTIRWLESLLEKDELDADWCSLTEDRPVWTRWWFRTGATALCIGVVWVLWPFV